jgi:Mg2+/Co2+ transporter CorB
VDDIHFSYLVTALIFLLFLSAFFSGSETGMMALNRYRLRHLAEEKHPGALRASALLERPDRLIGLILLGNNLVNISAASIATVIALMLLGEIGLAVAPIVLTAIVLIFGEVMPKTVAALYPERIAFPASFVLKPLLGICYPVVWVINGVSNSMLGVLGVRLDEKDESPLTREELRSIVRQAGGFIPKRHQQMLISILDLEKVTVADIMIPRNEIDGINLDDDEDEILEALNNCHHTRLPVYHGNLDNVIGILHVRRLLRGLISHEELSKDVLRNALTEPYFVPDSSDLHTQLLNFQRNKQRIGLVVDEYGVVVGLVTVEHILEEIVGEFTTDPQAFSREIHPQDDGSYLIDGGAYIREINRKLKWHLPTAGPKTLNGLILEHLESMPDPGISLRLGDYTIEITQTAENAVKMARIRHQPPQPPEAG